MPYASGVGCEDDKNRTGCTTCQNSCADATSINGDYLADNTRSGVIYPHDFMNKTTAMMYEIMSNGPIATCFDVFEDFFSFFRRNPRGVYLDSKERVFAGRHCVKIIGWGSSMEAFPGSNTTQLVQWWIAANSWGSWWGDNGFFRYRLGTNLGGWEGSDTFTGCVVGSGLRCTLTYRPRFVAKLANNEGAKRRTHGGGWTAIDASELAHDVSKLATHHMSLQLTSNSASTVQIVSVEKQVVAGLNYRLVYSIGGRLHEVKIFRNLADELAVLSMSQL